LNVLFNALRECGLRLNASKCSFLQEKVDYIGHTFTREGVMAEGKKIQDMLKIKTPTNKKALRSILGTLSYYRCYLKSFAHHAHFCILC